jgi:hypothetical protein
VTIHKAQGLTVDESILLVDERTTAEGLYVGMTRGRRCNVALAVCEEVDFEHGPVGPAPSAGEVVGAALGRSAAEVAALEALRDTLSRSDSMVTLGPRLANLDVWMAKEMPPDWSEELKSATWTLDYDRRHLRPGTVTRAGREDRRRLEAAQARYDAALAGAGRRSAWLEAHADTLAYREELAASVAQRRHQLGLTAAVGSPDHLVDLLGAVPGEGSSGRDMWVSVAGRIEAYREEWGVAPEGLRERPPDACQGRAWDEAVHTAEMLMRPAVPAPAIDQGLDLGIDLGW